MCDSALSGVDMNYDMHPNNIWLQYLSDLSTENAIPYAEASRDYVCKTSAATGRHVENFHITETTI